MTRTAIITAATLLLGATGAIADTQRPTGALHPATTDGIQIVLCDLIRGDTTGLVSRP